MTVSTNLAKFTIDGDPSSNRGYDVDPGATPELKLEGTPNVVVRQVTFEVYDPSGSTVARCSKDAPTLTLDNGSETGQSVDAATPSSGVEISAGIPANRGGGHLWEVDCKVNGGVDADGKVNPDYVFSRFIALRSVAGLRKIIPSERDEYSIETWSEAQNEIIEYLESQTKELGAHELFQHLGGCLIDYAGDVPSAYGTGIDETGSPLRYAVIGNMGSLGGTFGGTTGNARPEVATADEHRIVKLDGTDDYHEFSEAASVCQPLHDKGTLVVVVWPLDDLGAICATVSGLVATNTGIALFYNAGNLSVGIFNGSGTPRYNHSTSGEELKPGEPHIILLRYDSSESPQVSLRIDGVEVDTDNLTGAAASGAPDGTLRIARYAASGTSYLKSRICEIAFLDRYLNTGEAQDIENALRKYLVCKTTVFYENDLTTTATGAQTIITIDSLDVGGFADDYTVKLDIEVSSLGEDYDYSGAVQYVGHFARRNGSTINEDEEAAGAPGTHPVTVTVEKSGTDILVKIDPGTASEMHHHAEVTAHVYHKPIA
jgi:hypothetical protein